MRCANTSSTRSPQKTPERVFPCSILKTFVVVYDLVIYALDNAQTILP